MFLVLERVLKLLADQKEEFKQLKKEFKKLREKVELKLNASENPEVTWVLNGIADSDSFPNLPMQNINELYDMEKEITKDASKATSLVR